LRFLWFRNYFLVRFFSFACINDEIKIFIFILILDRFVKRGQLIDERLRFELRPRRDGKIEPNSVAESRSVVQTHEPIISHVSPGL